MHFVDALSRVGWSLQLPLNGTSNFEINPVLQRYSNGLTGDVRTWPLEQQHQWAGEWFGKGQVFQRPSASIMPTVPLRLDMYVQGIGWRTQGSGTYLAITVLLLHLMAAIAHSCFILVTGRTSEAWDSLTELLALAYNSNSVSRGLENCGAGIHRWKTLKGNVRIGIVGDKKDQDKERLQMVICNTQSIAGEKKLSEEVLIRRPKINQAYE